ncbi:unnamed protein product [Arctogadus glacialis]
MVRIMNDDQSSNEKPLHHSALNTRGAQALERPAGAPHPRGQRAPEDHLDLPADSPPLTCSYLWGAALHRSLGA